MKYVVADIYRQRCKFIFIGVSGKKTLFLLFFYYKKKVLKGY